MTPICFQPLSLSIGPKRKSVRQNVPIAESYARKLVTAPTSGVSSGRSEPPLSKGVIRRDRGWWCPNSASLGDERLVSQKRGQKKEPRGGHVAELLIARWQRLEEATERQFGT